jgi:hypothetical protein
MSNNGTANRPATPSIRQMVQRSNSGHRSALDAVAEGRPALRPGAYASEYRGMRIVFSTLRRWGCIDGDQLTERGRQLRDALKVAGK